MSERSGGTAFIGFKYGDKHSIDYFRVYRTSDGSRYNTNMIPSLTEKTVDVPGGDGQYYFYTKYKTRQFSIPIAFDELEEEKFYEMKQWLNGKEIKELTFDENIDIHYSAKVTGTPQLKTVCFEDDGKNIYKGEGTIQFTCYFPFGWEAKEKTGSNSTTTKREENFSIKVGGELDTTFELEISSVDNSTTLQVGDLSITVNSASKLIWDSKTGLVTAEISGIRKTIIYTGTSYGTIRPSENENDSINCKISSLPSRASYKLTWKDLYL